MLRYVLQPLHRPPPEGRTKYKTSPEIRDGMKLIRLPISTSALMIIRFLKFPHKSLKVTGIINSW
jgi:hypothetical protein